MSDFRGRGRGGIRGSRGRGGLPRGGLRGGSRGGYGDRDSGRGGFSRGRGDGFSRGRGGPPSRHLDRDESPPRKVPMMSRGYSSDRGRGPPMGRRMDKYEDSYDRGPPPRSRDPYPSPPRDTGRLVDRLTPPRGSIRDRDYGLSSRGSGEYPSARGDYISPRSYSPPARETGYRDSYGAGIRDMREDRRDTFSRPSVREYPSSRTALDYQERSRDFRDSPRDYGSSRDYPPSRGEFRDTLGGRGDFRDAPVRERLPPSRDFEDDPDMPPRGRGRMDSGRDHLNRHGGGGGGGGRLDHREEGHLDHHRGEAPGRGGDREYASSRFSSRMDDRVPSRGPPARDYPSSRDYGGRDGGGPRGGMRGSMRGGRDDRGGGRGYMNGSRGRGGPPRGRGRPDFAGSRGGRRSPGPSRDGPSLGKRPRMEGGDGYSSRR